MPLLKERYDLIIDQRFSDSELLKPLMDVLEDRDFRSLISELKGYDFDLMGKIIWESG